MKYVNLLDTKLTDEYATVNRASREVEKIYKPNKLNFKFQKAEYFFSIRKYKINGRVREYLTMILNSKMLREGYFEGLSITNMASVFHDIMEFGLFEVSYEDFLNKSFCTDIDFSLDYIQQEEEYLADLEVFKQLTPLSRERDRGYKSYKAGIEWNTRDYSSFSHPFVKIYDKEFELWKENNEFCEKYLLDGEIENRRRLEVNIKGKKELKKNGLRNSCLNSILSSSQLFRRAVLKNSFLKVINQPKGKSYQNSQNTSSMSHLNKVFRNLIGALIDKNMEREEILSIATENLDTNPKSDYKRKLKALYASAIGEGVAIPYILEFILNFF